MVESLSAAPDTPIPIRWAPGCPRLAARCLRRATPPRAGPRAALRPWAMASGRSRRCGLAPRRWTGRNRDPRPAWRAANRASVIASTGDASGCGGLCRARPTEALAWPQAWDAVKATMPPNRRYPRRRECTSTQPAASSRASCTSSVTSCRSAASFRPLNVQRHRWPETGARTRAGSCECRQAPPYRPARPSTSVAVTHRPRSSAIAHSAFGSERKSVGQKTRRLVRQRRRARMAPCGGCVHSASVANPE